MAVFAGVLHREKVIRGTGYDYSQPRRAVSKKTLRDGVRFLVQTRWGMKFLFVLDYTACCCRCFAFGLLLA